MHRFFTSGFRQPQKLQVWLLGYIVGTLRISFPYQIALYSSISKNFAQETLAMDFASLWFRIIPFTFKSSMQMVWFSRTAQDTPRKTEGGADAGGELPEQQEILLMNMGLR